MLKDLFIQNLILMESCRIEWASGLNVITGETGSGKTAILHGLRLLLGQKLDTSYIRRGASKGIIQARFEFLFPQELRTLLEEAGIPLEDTLILSREISIEGKSKSWINERWVSLSFLQKVGSYCVQIVGQHAFDELRHSDLQREIVDDFASLGSQTQHFASLLSQSKELQKTKEHLLACEMQKERELSFCLSQLEELNAIELKEGEEEEIFQEYVLMNQAEEIALRIDTLFDLISQNTDSLLSKIAQAKSLCKPYASRHKAFEEAVPLLENASISVQETLNLLQDALSDIDPDPQRKELLDQKLATIDQMKRKYGASVEDWNRYKTQLEKKVESFHRLNEQKEEIESKIKDLEQTVSTLAQELSLQRIQTAQHLEIQLTQTIQSLNMQGAVLQIKVEKQPRSQTGEDRIEFLLTANVGERATLVKESSSGGELSRLLLAVKLALAEKNRTPTLIFDEIDAGVGGETARLIGEKLKELSLHRQVLCITHFPQVACQAHLHLRVQKHQDEERTYAQIQQLDPSLQEAELLRMCGGKKTFSF